MSCVKAVTWEFNSKLEKPPPALPPLQILNYTLQQIGKCPLRSQTLWKQLILVFRIKWDTNCVTFSPKKLTKCEYCQHQQYILSILFKRKILIWNAFFSFSSDPARSDQCFAMSLSIIHSVPKSSSQAKLKFACICPKLFYVFVMVVKCIF